MSRFNTKFSKKN